jgi:hypothetical protein
MATSKKKQQPEPEPEPIGWYARLLRDVAAVSIQPPQTRDELVRYYKRRYPGTVKLKNGSLFPKWQDRLITDLVATTGLSRETIARRFRSRRGRDWQDISPSNAAAAQYKAIGDAIGVKPPRYGYHVDFKGWISFSECEKRQFEVNLTGQFAVEIAKNHALILDAMLLVYMEEDDPDRSITEQSPSVGICTEGDKTSTIGVKATDPTIIVMANQSKTAQGHSGRARRFSFFAR